MTQYYIVISTELLNSPDITWPDGFRLVERWGYRGKTSELWLVEDDNADPEFEDHIVDPWLERKADGKPGITKRTILAAPGLD